MLRRTAIGLISLLVAGLLFASGTGAAHAAGLQVTMTEMKFTPDVLSVTAGEKVHLDLINAGQLPHDFTIAAWGIKQVVQPGKTAAVEFTVPEDATGSVAFKCSQPGHALTGMKGSFTVAAAAAAPTPSPTPVPAPGTPAPVTPAPNPANPTPAPVTSAPATVTPSAPAPTTAPAQGSSGATPAAAAKSAAPAPAPAAGTTTTTTSPAPVAAPATPAAQSDSSPLLATPIEWPPRLFWYGAAILFGFGIAATTLWVRALHQ